jgi:EmrB/QacA subfamily drug resistance transporter
MSASVGSGAALRTDRHRFALPLLLTVQFMLILDSTIVGVALPSMARHLGFAQQDLSWVTNAYVLLFGGFLLLGGRLTDMFGRRQLFIGALVFFAAASLVGAVATTPGILLAARSLQGLASAFAAPAALSLVLTVYPDDTPEHGAERGKALTVYGAVSGAGGAAGMILGGILVTWFGWQAVFYVNVPIALAAAFIAPRILPRTAAGGLSAGFDLPGALTLTGGMSLLVYTLVETDRYKWGSSHTLGYGAAAIVLLVLFVVIELRTTSPLVPLGIFRRKVQRGGNVVGVFTTAGIIPSIFFFTLYLQQVRGFSPLRAGMAMVPLALSLVIAAMFLVARLIPRIGIKGTTVLGNTLVLAGALLGSRINGGAFFTQQFLPEVLIGAGGGIVWVCATVSATAFVPPEEAGLASGLFDASVQVGAALGLAILTTIATNHAHSLALAHSASPVVGGYRWGLIGAAVAEGIALVLAVAHLPGRQKAAAEDDQQATVPAQAQEEPVFEG